jgi:glutaredoxin-like protein
MSNILNDSTKEQVKEMFAGMQGSVQVLFFSRKEDCEYCDDTRQLLAEISEITDKIELSNYDLDTDAAIAEQYNVDKAPGIVIAGQNGSGTVDYGIRYAGIPSGHEFSSLVHDMLMVSSGDSGLNDATRTFLNGLEEPVHLQVFVTPTCPYCPRAVLLAHQMALESDMVQAEMVEAMEFPHLAQEFNVMGVPDTSINHGKGRVVGAMPEAKLIAEIQKVLSES